MTNNFLGIGIALFIFSIVSPAFADNLWDVVESAQKAIEQKYPSEDSIARKMALKELEEIAASDETDEKRLKPYRQSLVSCR